MNQIGSSNVKILHLGIWLLSVRQRNGKAHEAVGLPRCAESGGGTGCGLWEKNAPAARAWPCM